MAAQFIGISNGHRRLGKRSKSREPSLQTNLYTRTRCTLSLRHEADRRVCGVGFKYCRRGDHFSGKDNTKVRSSQALQRIHLTEAEAYCDARCHDDDI
jgi:hypothetical protein